MCAHLLPLETLPLYRQLLLDSSGTQGIVFVEEQEKGSGEGVALPFSSSVTQWSQCSGSSPCCFLHSEILQYPGPFQPSSQGSMGQGAQFLIQPDFTKRCMQPTEESEFHCCLVYMPWNMYYSLALQGKV